MSQSGDNISNISLHPTMVMDINRQMKSREARKQKNIDLSQVKKMQPFSFIVVTDPLTQSRTFAIVDFDGMGFLYFEKSIDKIPSEKGVGISQRFLFDLYEINKLSMAEFANLTQDKDLGNVFVRLNEKIAEISMKRYGVAIDRTLTTLNAMLALNLVESENVEAHNIEDCRKLAREVNDDIISKAAWFALRKREARFMIEREIIAAKL